MLKSNFDSVTLTGIGLFARDSSSEEAWKITPVPQIKNTANMFEWYDVKILEDSNFKQLKRLRCWSDVVISEIFLGSFSYYCKAMGDSFKSFGRFLWNTKLLNE